MDEFCHIDYIRRQDSIDSIPTVETSSRILPYEQVLIDLHDYVNGIFSSLSYMQLAILQIKRKFSPYFVKNGYTEYDVYRYHYYIYVHALSTLHDLFLKLIARLCNINMNKQTTSWREVSKQIKGEDNLIKLCEGFFLLIKNHETNRHRVSHEGFLAYKPLDAYHLTNIWTCAHQCERIENERLEYTDGTTENKRHLSRIKKSYMMGLVELLDLSIEYTIDLFELLLPKLIQMFDGDFVEAHWKELEMMDIDSINKYVLQISKGKNYVSKDGI